MTKFAEGELVMVKESWIPKSSPYHGKTGVVLSTSEDRMVHTNFEGVDSDAGWYEKNLVSVEITDWQSRIEGTK